jgi:hypothetical protein
MSPHYDKSVSQLVEKYLAEKHKGKLPLERPYMRRLIRAENKEFFSNPSNLRKLDRYLRKAYSQAEKQPQIEKNIATVNNFAELGPLGPFTSLFSSVYNYGEILRKETLLMNKELDKELEKKYSVRDKSGEKVVMKQ